MSDAERFTAWSDELRRVHGRLREALRVTGEALAAGEQTAPAARDLLLYCRGFCSALDSHHRGQDRSLFPAIEREHPDLAPTLRKLEQDHAMMAHLIEGLQSAVESDAAPADLARHLDGLGAIMESHFRYEERQLLTVLDTLAADAAPRDALGTL
ncbi:hemerythrin domain-containing protein [Microbacterium bovistercoris]|uniref:Hemerythrin domain-containing protein n=1 Tax=Microbacterium bovistercoris TaxID=2293570 RepID=A0A371NYB9_9MICO|nr:hemerythrin domain-containing protein [Microbacterium bovistercoris]REJ07882.1 hemerythrin domain-containing protein [Microbacterium bovistercoris]